MAKCLAVSSFVAGGSVGLRAAMAAMGAYGIEMIALPSVVLSNHPAHPMHAGNEQPVCTLNAILAALDANGMLDGTDAVILGYLPSAKHVAFADDVIAKVKARSPRAIIVVDPVLGDDPGGLYIDADAAAAIRDSLICRADIITPNRFELTYLSRCDVTDRDGAVAAARGVGPATVIATSVPAAGFNLDTENVDDLLTLAVNPDSVLTSVSPKQAHAPHGTGDLLTAVLTARLLSGDDLPTAFARACAVTDYAISISGSAPDIALPLVDWHRGSPILQHAAEPTS